MFVLRSFNPTGLDFFLFWSISQYYSVAQKISRNTKFFLYFFAHFLFYSFTLKSYLTKIMDVVFFISTFSIFQFVSISVCNKGFSDCLFVSLSKVCLSICLFFNCFAPMGSSSLFFIKKHHFNNIILIYKCVLEFFACKKIILLF